jgi:hypothetical protein
MSSDGSNVTPLLTMPGSQYAPAWSPDGSQIAFVGEVPGAEAQLYVAAADGSSRSALVSIGAATRRRALAWSPTGAVPPLPTLALEAAGGDRQTDTVRGTLANPLMVRLLRDGVPVSGEAVTWSVASGDGSVTASTTLTDAQGLASVGWTLGDQAGVKLALASVSGATGSPVVFQADARGGHVVALYSPHFEPAGVVSSFIEDLRAIARDAYGNGVAGARIQWRIVTGGGSIVPATATTGSDGYAWAEFTLGAGEGEHTVAVNAPDFPGVAEATVTKTAVTTLVWVSNWDWDSFAYLGDFAPADVTVPSDRTVAWVWNHTDMNNWRHNITFEDDPSEPVSSPTMGSPEGGVFFTRRFDGPPRIVRYRCTLHSSSFSEGEIGSVTVR